MRIAQVSTLATTVRPGGGGSIEGLVWLLSRELTRMGHEVTLFAAAGSASPGELVPTLPGTYGEAGCPERWVFGRGGKPGRGGRRACGCCRLAHTAPP